MTATEYIGQPATAEAEPPAADRAVAPPTITDLLHRAEQDNARLRDRIRIHEQQNGALWVRVGQLEAALDRANKGMTTPASRPMGEPWPRAASQELTQLRANLVDLENRLAAAEGRPVQTAPTPGVFGRIVAGVGSRL